jgi:hypothetical protein
MGGQGELRIMNIEVYFLVRNSEFNIRYSIFNAYVFPGAMNRAPTILYDESRPYGHGTPTPSRPSFTPCAVNSFDSCSNLFSGFSDGVHISLFHLPDAHGKLRAAAYARDEVEVIVHYHLVRTTAVQLQRRHADRI